MSNLVSIEVTAASQKQVTDSLEMYGKDAVKAIKRAVQRTALAIETVAKRRLNGQLGSKKHWITGRLAASVHAELDGVNTFKSVKDSKGSDGDLNEQIGSLEAIVGTNVEYGPKIEFQYDSYLRFAAEAEKKKFEDRIIEELNKIK